MPSVCFYFQVHQPTRIKRYRVFDIGRDHKYFNHEGEGNLNNRAILNKVSAKSYLPTNKVLLKLLKDHPEFKISFSFSGVVLEQMLKQNSQVLQSFIDLVKTGRAEVLSETYHHSLSSVFSPAEFKRQIDLHKKLIKKIFGVTPKIFRNTELIYSDSVAHLAEELGFEGILAEGADHVLGWRSPNYVYSAATKKALPILMKNYKLSDDIAFRFSTRDWPEYPLTADKYAVWIGGHHDRADIINLFMDYETFGEHQWEETGILEFLSHLPRQLLKNPGIDFVTPSEAIERFKPVAQMSIPYYVSWADVERDLSAWMENSMQKEALAKLYELEEQILQSGDQELIDDWRKLQTSDHFYYMCTKWFADGDVHKYFNPYQSPYDAFISYMNVLADLKLRLQKKNEMSREDSKELQQKIRAVLKSLKKESEGKPKTTAAQKPAIN